MKILLVAINAKYIHSNLGLYSMKAYADTQLAHHRLSMMGQIEIGEYTINHQREFVLKEIYQKKPDMIGISCYVWNIRFVMPLISDIKKILPDCNIWLGGPEVSYHADEVLKLTPEVTGIIRGEGEQTFAELSRKYLKNKLNLVGIAGITYRNEENEIIENSDRGIMNMDDIPFVYHDLTEFQHRIIYYESSRGCPFSCSYCLSSVEKSVRFRSIGLVKAELQFFLEKRVPQVKFVDRTFNCHREHTREIWKFLLEHDNGETNFHFEISADLLKEEELELIRQMRPGLIQLEIGVQSTNLVTIKEINRSMDLAKLAAVVGQINQFGNVHQHLDLIAGLPFETFSQFQRSFNEVYAMRPEQLQLGFLKILKGSNMEQMSLEYGLQYQSEPPYEVLKTRWLSYDEVIQLKAVEEVLEVYYNSGQFRNTLAQLEMEFKNPFQMLQSISNYYESNQLFGINHNRMKRYEILNSFMKERGIWTLNYTDLMVQDLYLRENLKSRPSFGRDQMPFKKKIKEFFIREASQPVYLKGYENFDSRQMSKIAHVEVLHDGSWILFDYLNRDALLHNAKAIVLCPDNEQMDRGRQEVLANE